MNATADVTAELGIAFRDGRVVHEDGFADLSPENVLGLDSQEGVLVLRHGDTHCQLGDVLLNLVSTVCVEIPSQLEAGEQAWFGAYASEMVMSFRPSGDTISVIDEGIPPYDFPAAPLIAALQAAGQRYGVLLRALWPDAPQDVLDQFSA
ncbi:hypothetical protein [Ruegeria jejuensis]|uniref:hypothetical protein n=1 Tax=Ruegeria jejuensis TaxID=3233338 RepID=UPI00355C9E01